MELGMTLNLGPAAAPLKMFLLTGTLLLEYVTAFNWYGRNEDVCYILRYREARIHRNYIDKYASVHSLRACESACDQAFFACKSFSYSDHQSLQCLLSRENTYTLSRENTYTRSERNRDFDNDREFDFYERKTGRDCDGGGNYGGGSNGGTYKPDRPENYGGECYTLKRTREMISQRYIRLTRRTRDRSECEELCSRESYCRGFNYRYKSHGSYQYKDNCELSEEDTSGAYHRDDFHTDDEFDFYEKSSSSRDCERGYGTTSNYDRPNYNRDDECFRIGKSNYRLDDHVVRNSLYVRDRRECEQECLRSTRFKCRGFAHRYDSYNGRTSSNSWYDRQDNCFLTDRSTYEISNYYFIYDRNYEFYELSQNGRDCSDYGREDNYYPDHNGYGGRYTVSNLECYRGSRCREDHTAGYWWCEYDEAGAWDYCCQPDETCGRSRNFESMFAWCYVGTGSSTQWRSCTPGVSDRQYLKQDDPPNVTTTLSPSNEDSLEVVDLNDII